MNKLIIIPFLLLSGCSMLKPDPSVIEIVRELKKNCPMKSGNVDISEKQVELTCHPRKD